MDLEGIEARGDQRLAQVELGERRLERRRPALVEEPRQFVEQQTRSLEPELHLDDLRGHRLEAPDRMTELLPFARICDAALELPLHRADGGGEDEAPLPLHRRVENGHARARLGENLRRVHAAVLKKTSFIGDVRRPIFERGEPTTMPGVARSTRNAQSPARPI